MKIFINALILLLAVHIMLSFAQQPVTITVTKDVIEPDLAGFNLYQDNNTEPFAIIESNTAPAAWQGEITLINGKTTIYATAFDTSGNESEKSPGTAFDPPPSVPGGVTVVIVVAGGN
jgi:hypothetical protein